MKAAEELAKHVGVKPGVRCAVGRPSHVLPSSEAIDRASTPSHSLPMSVGIQ